MSSRGGIISAGLRLNLPLPIELMAADFFRIPSRLKRNIWTKICISSMV